MRRFLAVAIVLALFAACSDEEITLATLPATTDAGKPMEKTRCVTDADCPSSTAFCGRKTCADVGGLCFERPAVCSGAVDPVCGCDGITYWNECTRRLSGVTSQTDGLCDLDVAQTCTFEVEHPGAPVTSITTCPGGTFCARLFPPSGGGPPECPVASKGACWVLPTVCPDDPGTSRWTKCGDEDTSCHPTCDAIRSGQPYQSALSCP